MMRFAAMNLGHLKISTRLVILISVLSVTLIGIGCIGLYGINQANGALRRVVEDRTVPMGQVAEIQRLKLRNRLAIAKVWDAYMATEQRRMPLHARMRS
jgi:hypothetical protein